MHRYFFIIICIILMFSSCRSKFDDCTEQDYANCNTERPQTGRITARLTINSENRRVPVRVYEGNFEDGKLVREDTISIKTFNYFLTPDTEYSMVARYLRDNDTIMVVNKAYIRVIRYRMCELRCYDLDKPEVDLRLY